jgi:hypothetical protein
VAITQQNFEIYAGDERQINIQVEGLTSAAGYSLSWSVSRKPWSPDVITKTMASGITVHSPDDGGFTIPLVSSDSSELNGLYWHEAWTTDQDDNDVTILSGWMIVKPSAK